MNLPDGNGLEFLATLKESGLDSPLPVIVITGMEKKEIILQAAQRQQFIDQSQSLNLMIHPSVPAKDINQLYALFGEKNLKQ